jgi:hypothetical protein
MKFVNRAWKLSPSDLTFLFEECAACFWKKVAGGFPRPRTAFPKIFTVLDVETKRFFADKRTEQIADGIRPGRVLFGDRWVRSGPIVVPGHQSPIFLGGRFDTALLFDDSSYGIIDYKTTDPRSAHLSMYGRQLHAYALAAENPAPGSLSLNPVTQLGLLCVQPVQMIAAENGVAYKSEPHWIELPRDDEAFLGFLSEVVAILEQPFPPESNPECKFCSYLMDGVLSLLSQTTEREELTTP